jgi:hypothetical protein
LITIITKVLDNSNDMDDEWSVSRRLISTSRRRKYNILSRSL